MLIEDTDERTGGSIVNSGELDAATRALHEATAQLGGVAGLAGIQNRLNASTSPARGLHQAAVSASADMIVVGSHHRGTLGQVVLGSLGEGLLTGAPCAVAIAPRGYATRDSGQIGAIAVAFDDSAESRLALRVARALASRTNATLRALIVIQLPSAFPGHFVPLPTIEQPAAIERTKALQKQETAVRSALAGALRELGPGAPVEQQIMVGSDPAAEILGASQTDVDLLVLGSRAYEPARHALLGNVSSAVIRGARCPVLITPRISDGGA